MLQVILSNGKLQQLLGEFYFEAHIRSASEKITSRMQGRSGRVQNLHSQAPFPPGVMPKELLHFLEGRQQLLALLVWALE